MTIGNYKICKSCGHYTNKSEKHGQYYYHAGCWRRLQIARQLKAYKPTLWERFKYTITRKPVEVEIKL